MSVDYGTLGAGANHGWLGVDGILMGCQVQLHWFGCTVPFWSTPLVLTSCHVWPEHLFTMT